MNKFLRVLFILVIIAMSGAIIWYFCRLATGDWDLEYGSPCDLDCRQSQIRLVLSSDGTSGLDHWWVWNWDQSSFQLFSLSSAGQWDWCA